MARRAVVRPDWLDSMLWQWGLRALRGAGLGYPTVCPMLKEGIPQQARSFEPEGLCDQDFAQLEGAVAALEHKHQMAVIRAYRPWTAKTIEHEFAAYGVSDRSWQRWLHEAAEKIVVHMERMRVEPRALRQHEPEECR